MGKHIYIDGDLAVTTGDLYTRNISSGGTWHPDDSVIITPQNGRMEITEDTGSIFDSYYVSGSVACGGILGVSKGAIVAFGDIYDFTVQDYEAGLFQIERMLELNIPKAQQSFFYQQQYASVFSLLEWFLTCTFVRQTCDREDSYQRVLASGELQKWSTKKMKSVLNGSDCLQKELFYIEAANRVIYHNANRVGALFKAAFDIDVDLSVLDMQLEVRNHIAHRFGHTKDGVSVSISESSVRVLINSVDKIVKTTIEQIRALPQSERLYP